MEDPFAVSIVRNGVIVGHVPSHILCVSPIYLCCGGIIVYGNRREEILKGFAPRRVGNTL